MKNIEVFIMFPSSEGDKHEPSFYLSNDDLLEDEEKTHGFFEKLERSVEWLIREKNTTIYYNGSNLKDFLENTKGLDVTYLSGLEDRIMDVIEEYPLEIKKLKNEEFTYQKSRFYLWFWENETVRRVYDTLAEVAERKLQRATDAFAILNLDAFKSERNPLTIFRDKEYAHEKQLPVFTYVDFVNTEEELWEWLKKNRQLRQYDHSWKHGENGKGAQLIDGQQAAPLLGSIREAKALLPVAIGVTTGKHLSYWDDRYKHFIVFEDAVTEKNEYHGYHTNSDEKVHRKDKEFIKNAIKKGYNASET